MDFKNSILQEISTIGPVEAGDVEKLEILEEKYINESYKTVMQTLALEQKKAEIKRYKKEHRIRIKLVNQLFIFSIIFLGVVFVIVTLNSLQCIYISDQVMITILTSSTAEILGFFYLVLKYLYNSNKST